MAKPSNSRVVGYSTIKGVFGLPIGIKFPSRDTMDKPQFVAVSTVCLDGASLEDPLGICEPETGYESMVFLEGCTFFSLFTQKYSTRREAADGHNEIVRRLLAMDLPLAIPLSHYYAWESVPEEANSLGTNG